MSSKRSRDIRIGSYRGPVGGWGSAIDVAKILLREAVPLKGALALWRQNKPRGFACGRGRLVVPKTTLDGVAVAVVEDDWRFAA